MKTFFALFLSTALISFTTSQTVPRHNVFFPWNSTELKGTSAAVVESIYKKLANGNKVRFGIKGPISNVHNTTEKNRMTSERANSIVALIEQIKSEDDKIEILTITPLFSPTNSDRGMTALLELEVLLTKAPGWIEPAFTSIDDYLPLPVQSFTINPREDNRLVGEQGTVINIPAFTLELKNGSVPSEMTVELTEVYGNGQIINANLHTNSRGRMLETGGTVNLEANAYGKPAHVAKGEAVGIEFPYRFMEEKLPEEDMQVFNGRVDRAGNFDWVEDRATGTTQAGYRETFYINDELVSKEEYYRRMQEWEERKAERERDRLEREQLNENHEVASANGEALDAYLLSTDELGWINCDRFYDVEEKTDIIVMVDTAYRPSVRMVFDNIASVMNGYYSPKAGTVTFRDVPAGEAVKIVGYSIKDDIPYMANRNVVVKQDLKMDLALTATTKAQMQSELVSLN